jgi:hypothetical protein
MKHDSAKEFYDDHKHLFDQALQLRLKGSDAEANQLYYLLNIIVDKCKTIDELKHEA